MTFRELVKSVSVREWLIVEIAAAAAVALTALPPLVGWLFGIQRGLEWTGMQAFSPGDLGVYLSYIVQGKAGSPFMVNMYTTEVTAPVFNILWFSVGQLAWMFSLAPLVAYHAARLILIPVLLSVSYLAISFFLAGRRERLTAFLMLAFGSGFGLYAAPLFSGSSSSLAGHEWPIDLWVSEANVFASMSYSPHFVASWLFFLSAALFLALAFDSGKMRYGAIAGTAALVLFSFHPFHAPTLYALGFVCLFAMRKFRGREAFRSWSAFAIFVALSAPAVLYHYALSTYDTVARSALAANSCLTPAFWHVLIGFGAFALLAPVGVALARSRRAEFRQTEFLAVWVIVCLILVYSPLTFQRRLLEGLQFPLAVLAAPAAIAILHRLTSKLRIAGAILAAVLFIIFLLPSSFSAVARNIIMYAYDEPPIFYLSADRSAAFDWIKGFTPDDAAFMADVQSGYFIAGWADRRVYIGHWANSGDVAAESGVVRRFFAEMDDLDREEFMHASRLQYVFVGPGERALGGLSETGRFELVYAVGDIEIFRLKSQNE